MKLSLNWLKEYVALTQSPEEIERAITLIGLEVENVAPLGLPPLPNVVVGEVLERNPHPNADRLSVCRVSLGPTLGERTIVCGAQNYRVGDRVPVALPGAVLPGNFAIKRSKIRGVESDGMMCSARELGYAGDADGLLILDQRPPLGFSINDALPDADAIFDIEVTPNRPDCLSHLGVARELAAFLGLELKYPETKFNGALAKDAPAQELLTDVRVDSSENCPLYLAHVITGVRIGPSPDWMQRRLRAIGLRPINNVVDCTNFVLMELGQPLHAFDAAKLDGGRIDVRLAQDSEKIVTLDGKERTLNSRMLVIADAARAVAVAGVMGSAWAEVDANTTDIVLESAYFRPQSVRWTSRRLGLSSDSSYRYERGVDSVSLPYAAHRAVDLIIATAGGTLAAPVFRCGTERRGDREIVVAPAWIEARCGFEISAEKIRSCLEALELEITREEPTDNGPQWTVAIPSFRGDLDRPIDLVEEVLRMFGTDRIPSAKVVAPGIVASDDAIAEFGRAARAYLIGQHFHECVNYTLRPAAETAEWLGRSQAAELGLANPMNEDQTHLRASLIPGLLDVLKLNQYRRTGAVRLFECGRTFRERNGVVDEMISVGFLITPDDQPAQWLARSAPDFFTAKNLAFNLARLAGIDPAQHEIAAVPGANTGWQDGQSAMIEDAGGSFALRMGVLDLARLRARDVSGRVLGGILSILPEKLPPPHQRRRYAAFSAYPPALRDLALVVGGEEHAGKVRTRLTEIARRAAAGKFDVERIEVFDRYEGKGLPEGRRSLAFSLTFRSAERTLTDDEVNRVFQQIQTEAEKDTGWQVRR